jgi:hypothetical protein
VSLRLVGPDKNVVPVVSPVMSLARRPRPVVALARLAVVLAVAAAATGCGSDGATNDSPTHPPETVSAAFEQAGLPVVEPVEGTVSCDDLFRDADDMGARTGEFRCVALESIPLYPDAVRLLPSASRDFIVDVFQSEADASEAEAFPLDPEAFDGRTPVVLREANVVVVVLADEARRAEIQTVLDGL